MIPPRTYNPKHSRRSSQLPLFAGLVVAATVATGCQPEAAIRPDDVRRYTAPREKLAQASALAAMPRPAAAPVTPRVTYTLPEGWTEKAGPTGMRLATLAIGDPADGQEVTIIPAAGSLRSNVERWQKQLDAEAGAEVITATVDRALAEAGSVDVEGRQATVVLLNPGSVAESSSAAPAEAILGGILPLEDGKALFVKFRGDANTARRERTNFLKFVASLRMP